MPIPKKTFDTYLPSINADKLKKMARMWGGSNKLRKDECLEVIQAGLRDPAQVRAAFQNLDPWEQNALAILKRLGGEAEINALKVAIYASGLPLPPRLQNSRWNRDNALTQELFERGLILSGGYNPGYFSGYRSDIVYTDPRLLAEAGFPQVQPFQLNPIPEPRHLLYRRPPTVALDVIGMLQAVANLGGLGLTKASHVRDTDTRKLRKAMKWSEEEMRLDGFFFPDPATAWISAFRYSEILKFDNEFTLTLAEAPEGFAARPYGEQVRMLLDGFLRSTQWLENRKPNAYDSLTHYPPGRLALLMALQSLPLQGGDLFSMDDFERELFARVGEHFSLNYVPDRPYSYRDTSKEKQKQELADWQAKIRANWLAQERPWIEAALTTWAYFLGIVELGVEANTLVGLRLTPLGREVLHPELAAPLGEPASLSNSAPSVWVVQPNFDVVAYLDQVTPVQLAFLERFADREQAHHHTAHYRLTRQSTYRGLERGATLADLLEGLQNGAHAELPQNVVVELREWAALREQISLHRRARVVEFPDEPALQVALRQGWTGTVIGERFLRVTGDAGGLKRVDYAAALPACLTVSETGDIQLKRGYHDLWIRAQLAQWGETLPDRWRLTAASVAAAIRRGRRISDLFNLLAARLTRPLPALLRVALRAWAGETLPVELGTVLALRCGNDEIFQALAASEPLQPFLKGKLAPNILLVDEQEFERVKAVLDWAGLAVSEQFEVTPLNRAR